MDRNTLRRSVGLCAEGDWAAAHALINHEESDPLAMWIHAWLHRIEGDLDNARYWYRKAGRPPAVDTIDDERARIEAALAAATDDLAQDPAPAARPGYRPR